MADKKKKSTFWSEFKTFIARGNVMDMAVGVVVGSAFTAIVNSLVQGIINPLIGNAGVSAVPDSARISQVIGLEYDPTNYLLMHAMGPNVAGVIGSAVAAGILLGFLM